MVALRRDVAALGGEIAGRWEAALPIPKEAIPSVRNLAAYLALRHHDLRDLQDELAFRGLSSLGRCESRVMATLDAVCATLARCSANPAISEDGPNSGTFYHGVERIEQAAEALFGPPCASGSQIMVTLPASAATERTWCRRMIEAGVGCFRVNCAHDGPELWGQMIRNVRTAAKTAGREVRVEMDLTGPRARTAECRLKDGERRAKPGDKIFLARQQLPPEMQAPFEAVCSLPAVVDALEEGTMLCFNEGRLGAVVTRKTSDGVLLTVSQVAKEKGERFRSDMGINVLDVPLRLPALTERDRQHLDVAVQEADIVGYSFVQSAADMDVLHEEIAARSSLRKRERPLAVVAKIETALAVQNLPEIIVHGLCRAPLGVMIARGDLAVELGPVRLAEIQEELLWICEAAHVPVVWATQVLESLAKKGLPSRAELTDAAMSERAECVMLNKGPYILEAVKTLDAVLSRMKGHQRKKMARFRPLRSWEHLLGAE
jgi:pyruvate kinase